MFFASSLKFERRQWISVSAFFFIALTVVGVYQWSMHPDVQQGIHSAISGKPTLTKETLAEMLGNSARFYHFPTEMDFGAGMQSVRGVIQYAFDPKLQESMEDLFQAYKPDYGAFVAMDASTGQILSMVSYSIRGNELGNLALRATFPSASVFKVVTAAAAISERNFSPETVISFNGSNHTLYRNNVLGGRVTRWTRSMTLKTAFAKSVNTVFGKIGALTMGPSELRNYADRFGFNHRITADFPVEEGRAPVPDDPWERAETASGYTRENTMSPLQGALIAATVANDGVMMEPFVVKSVYTVDGNELYSAKPKVLNQAVSVKTAEEIRELMKETVARGTSHKSFRGFFMRDFAHLEVGGKTGSLTGDDPVGKYDWFVGFAKDGQRRIAFSSLTIHEKFWRVKSSYLVRKAIETYFKKNKKDENT